MVFFLKMTFLRTFLVLIGASLSSTANILTWPPLNCSRQGLRCKVIINNCMDSGWLNVHEYTPSSPEELQVSVDTRQDKAGHLHPVLVAHWKLRDDGSIHYLKATELHILVTSTNQNLCVRYAFQDRLPMRSPSGEKWSFSASMMEVDPGQRYRASVVNIPKPKLAHSSYDVSADVSVPDCQDPTMQRTQFCIERGSLWRPNISLARVAAVGGRSALAISFSPDALCDEYIVIISCSATHQEVRTYKANQTQTLNGTFSLDKWPRSCCQFDAEIKPLFPQCGQDCTRQRRTLDICRGTSAVKRTDAPDVPLYTFVTLGVVFMCVVMAVIMYVFCRNPGKADVAAAPVGGQQQWQLKQPPKVLVIYSQDHRLHRDVILKLCAFLQAKCGTKVLVDLLDSTMVSVVGRLRWLEWQRQQLKHPSDKILVLCSRGVQAKWRAMCGQGRVTLREDVLSPNDDMLTPFLNLFLPDMHQVGMLGKYLVAYFDDISSERDIPSIFDIAVKYKLMKQFEDLYFRILDIEKYQPDQVNHIEGIDGDEYFNCPSGRALKSAIEIFKDHQLKNPDWFEKECVDGTEEVTPESDLLIDQLHIPPVLECVPLIRHGPPVYFHEVEVNENGNSVLVSTPELNRDRGPSSLAELTPAVNPEHKHQHPSTVDKVLTGDLCADSSAPESVYEVEPVLNKPSPPRQSRLSLEEETSQVPTEDEEEEDSLLPTSQHSARSDQRSLALRPLDSKSTHLPGEHFLSPEVGHSRPVEMEQREVREPGRSGQSSGSDQGYISKIPSQQEPPFKEDPLVALRRLQEELFQKNLRYSNIGPDGN